MTRRYFLSVRLINPSKDGSHNQSIAAEISELGWAPETGKKTGTLFVKNTDDEIEDVVLANIVIALNDWKAKNTSVGVKYRLMKSLGEGEL